MKYLITIMPVLLMHFYAEGQLPQAVNFQGVARGDNGRLIKNTVIGLRLTIIDRADGGKEIYREKHSDTTDAYGFFSLQVGRPLSVDKLPNSVDFKDILWQTGDKFLQIEFDTTAGQTFPIKLGTLEMVTVPFAFAAGSVTNIQDQDATKGEVLVFDGNNWIPGRGDPGVSRTSISYTAKNGDDLILVDARNNDVTIKMPDPLGYKRILKIQVENARNDVWVKPYRNEKFLLTVDSSDTIAMASIGDYVELVSDGINWSVIDRNIAVRVQASSTQGQAIPFTSGVFNVNCNAEQFDTHKSFTPSSSTFMVPQGCSGTYYISIAGNFDPGANALAQNMSFDFRYRINNKSPAIQFARHTVPTNGGGAGKLSCSGSISIYLAEGDMLEIEAIHSVGSGTTSLDAAYIYLYRLGN